MELKCVLLCFALFVVATSAAPGCKWRGPKGENRTVSKYNVKIDVGGKNYIEEITIDTKNQTETFHIPKMNSSNAGEVDVVYDFKRNLVMRRMYAQKACFLSNITENVPGPNDLKKALDELNGTSPSPQPGNSTQLKYEVVGIVNNRSRLSDEMAGLCVKLPIYHIKKNNVGKRFRRLILYRRFCPLSCYNVWRCWWVGRRCYCGWVRECVRPCCQLGCCRLGYRCCHSRIGYCQLP